MSELSTLTRPSPFWYLLLLVPAAVSAVFLVPGLGDYGEGLWPEWFLFEQKGSLAFGDLAGRVTFWTIGTLVVALIAASALYVWTREAWWRRLRTFDVDEVSQYRTLVSTNLVIAFGVCIAIATFAVFLSESLRDAAAVSWVIFAVVVGLFGSLQLFAMVLGFPTTLRLYRGK